MTEGDGLVLRLERTLPAPRVDAYEAMRLGLLSQ
jgi:hypothetical protein